MRASFYYCTAIEFNDRGCTYANASEKAVQDHIREHHPGSCAVPRRLGLSPFHGGMANIGPSCSVTAVVAALATLPGGHAVAPELASAFRASTADAARAALRALALRLPASPGEVLEAIAARDPAAASLFHATARQDVFCRACGVQTGGAEEP